MTDTNLQLWESHAAWWQEEFTEGADPEYEEQILPLVSEILSGAERVLDVGCGEGQVARRLVSDAGADASTGDKTDATATPDTGARAETGARSDTDSSHTDSSHTNSSHTDSSGTARTVVGVDPVSNQVRVAAQRAGGPTYAQASAGALPFGEGGFDAVVACLVFEHIDPLEPALAEVSRVLRPGGRFLFLLNHPLLQSPDAGWVVDHTVDPPEQYWRVGDYLKETHLVEEVEKGVFIPFVHRPLGRYVNGLREAGLVLDEMLEPAPPPGFLVRAPGYESASAIPRLLALICHKS